MKRWFLPTALVAVAALIVLDGCSEPAPVSKSPAPSSNAKDDVARAPTAPRSSDSSESNAAKKSLSDAKMDGGEPKAGIAVPVDSSDSGTVTSQPIEKASKKGSLGDRTAGKDVAPKKTAKPVKKFKLEFVSATGEEGLNPGDTIPNIEGKDIDGIKFELSDYQGKVVMIDFWGDW